MSLQRCTEADLAAFRSARIDEMSVARRVARVKSRSLKADTKDRLLRLAVSMVDLTTLEGMDTPDRVRALCHKASRPLAEQPDLPSTAAVCVYPAMVPAAREALGTSSPVGLASVATGFPSGQLALGQRLSEVRWAIDHGATEIDMVISRGRLLTGDWGWVFDEIAATREACGPVVLKVIFETGELGSLETIAGVSQLAIAAGADFIKTSTGKISPAATMPVTFVMLDVIREHYLKTGRMVGMKPAGGIRTAKQALQYLVLVAETLGADWLTNERFRFGASSLLNDLLRQLIRRQEGTYPSPRRISVD